MQCYEVLKPVSIYNGLVELDEDQARRRKHSIRVVKEPVKGEKKYINGLYEVLKQVMFKKGEKFKWDGEFSKLQLLDSVEKLTPVKEEKPVKKTATKKPNNK